LAALLETLNNSKLLMKFTNLKLKYSNGAELKVSLKLPYFPLVNFGQQNFSIARAAHASCKID